MVLPEDAEPLPLSVNQEKGRNGEPPDLLDPSTDSLWREHQHGCGHRGVGAPPSGTMSGSLPAAHGQTVAALVLPALASGCSA